MKAAEPTLAWGTKLLVQVGTNSDPNDTVCLSELSKSGSWFAVGDVANSSGAADDGTYFKKSSTDPCTTDPSIIADVAHELVVPLPRLPNSPKQLEFPTEYAEFHGSEARPEPGIGCLLPISGLGGELDRTPRGSPGPRPPLTAISGQIGHTGQTWGTGSRGPFFGRLRLHVEQ